MKRDWEKQELDAMERLALNPAERARWDSLDTRRLLPSRAARRFAGLRRMLMQDDPVAGYHVDAGEAFRVPFRQDGDESVMCQAAEAARAEPAAPAAAAAPKAESTAPGPSGEAAAPQVTAPSEAPSAGATDPEAQAPKPESPLARMMRRRRRRQFRR